MLEGAVHVLSGLDHLLFLVAVLVAVARFRDLALLVTSFTVAHSLTLALGSLGVVSPPATIVEPLIALSVLFVAVENVVREAPARRHLVTFGFGLLHGFGFSSALAEMGLPQDHRLLALSAFNVGVELGQLAVVMPLFPAIAWLARWKRAAQARRSCSAAIAVVATVWLIERISAIGLLSG
jgi:hydrogenase/urease accessory protein HupE